MNLPLRAENGTKHAARSSARSWLLLEIFPLAGAVIFYFGVLRPSLARTELNTRLLKDLKVCRGNAHLDVIRRLLQQGANPNAADTGSDSLTALTIASGGGYPPVVELLLDAGAIVSDEGKIASIVDESGQVLDGVTPPWAAFSGNSAVCKMLIERGADIHAVDSRNGSIILYSRSNDVVELLLGQGLDINARDKDRSTLSVVSAAAYASGDPHSFAACAAAGSGVPDRDFLLKHGADPNVRTKAGLTPLNALKASSRRPDLVDLPRRAGARESLKGK
jgi:ankyrin repeat protein